VGAIVLLLIWLFIHLPDDVITELIAAIVAARADGDGVLTIAAVRTRLGSGQTLCDPATTTATSNCSSGSQPRARRREYPMMSSHAQVLANFERELQKANSHSFKHIFLSIFVA
jgi:hypothetical protein